MHQIICHIAGPAGSGKTTILKKIKDQFKEIATKDLDEFDEAASLSMGLSLLKKKLWKDSDLIQLVSLKQKLLDDFIKKCKKTIVLGGVHAYRKKVHIIITIPTAHKFLIDTNAITSTKRLHARDRDNPLHRRSVGEFSRDIEDAQKEIDFLIAQGYEKKSEKEILDFIGKQLV